MKAKMEFKHKNQLSSISVNSNLSLNNIDSN